MKKGVFILALALLSSCAASYTKINPRFIYFENKKSLTKDVDVFYMYDTQYEVGNRKYSKLEKKSNLTAVGIKIHNHSDLPLFLTPHNLRITNNLGKPIQFVDPKTYFSRVRQKSENFLLYGLAGIGLEAEAQPDGTYGPKFIYTPIPLIFGLGHLLFAELSNAKWRDNMKEHNIFGKTIQPNSTFYGIILLPENNYPELNFHYMQ